MHVPTGPVRKVVAKQTADSLTKRLTDTSKYTAAHKHRFDKNGVGAEKVQDKSSVGPGGDGMGHAPLVPVLSYKERLKQMQAAATASAAAGGGKKRKKRK